jgi:hypothetical protein
MADEYPEHKKLSAVRDQSQKCGEFFEWLQSEKGVTMECSFEYERDEDDEKIWRDEDGNVVEDYVDPESYIFSVGSPKDEKYRKMRDERGIHCRLIPTPGGSITMPIRQPLSSLLAEFFEIDENKLEEEKRAMLEACRKAHATKEG